MIEMLRTADGGELMVLQAVVDAEATAHIGAGLHQRTDDRTAQATAPQQTRHDRRRGSQNMFDVINNRVPVTIDVNTG